MSDNNLAAGPLARLDYDTLIEGVNKLVGKLFSGLVHTKGDAFWDNEALNIGFVHMIASAALGAKGGGEPLTAEAQDLFHMRAHETTVLNLMLLHRLRTGRLPPDASRLMGQKLQEMLSGQLDNPFQRNVHFYRAVIGALVQFFSREENAAVHTLLGIYDDALALQTGARTAPRPPIDDRKLAKVTYRVILGFIERDARFGEVTDDHDLQAASDAATILTAAALARAPRQHDQNASIDALLQVIHNVSSEHLQSSRVQRAQAIARRLDDMNPAAQAVMLQSLSASQVTALGQLLQREADGADVMPQITDLVQAISTAYWRQEGVASQLRH